MVNKNISQLYEKINYDKVVFSLLLLVYATGLCSGCAFALKNGDNMLFVSNVTFTSRLGKIETDAILSYTLRYFARDLACFAAVLILKYSGVLKGMCLCVPFIASLQNASIYCVLLSQKEISIFNLIFYYILRDTAVAFLLLSYCYIIINDIIKKRQNIKADFKKSSIYIGGILFIYMIDYGIKLALISR